MKIFIRQFLYLVNNRSQNNHYRHKSIAGRVCLILSSLTICLTCVLGSYSLLAQTYVNPVGDLADPFITYIDGYYYYTGTTGGDVSMKRATTLEGLKGAPIARLFGPGDPGAQAGVYWAPELFKLDGKWYIYYTAAEQGTNDLTQRTFVLENATSDPLSNNWVFKGKIFAPGADYWAIDGTVIEISGDRYFFWSGVSQLTHTFNSSKPQRIYVAKMSNPWTLTGSRTLLSSPGELSGGNFGDVNEAPEVVKKNGKVSMVYSANGCWTPHYKLGMMSMNETSDPLLLSSWTKHSNPVFESNNLVEAYGPGHHSFFKSPDGTEDWFAYHSTTNSSGGCDNTRTTRVQKLAWNANNTPFFGVPNWAGKPRTAPSGEGNLPSGSTISNGIYRITVKSSGKSLDVNGCSLARGANVHQWTSTGARCQQWIVQATTDGYYTISSVQGGMSLEVVSCSNSNGANVQMWSPNGADCQKWSFVDDGGGYYRIVSKQSGKVLDIQFGGAADGLNLQQYTWLGNDNQRFQLTPLQEPVVPGVYRIVSKYDNTVIDLASCSPSNGANIQKYFWLDNDCQKWSLEDAYDGGRFKVVSKSSGKVIDLDNCSTSNGANIRQWQDMNNDCQKWMFEPVGGDYFKIVAKSSGQVMDIEGGGAQYNILQWPYWGGDNQKWKLEELVIGWESGSSARTGEAIVTTVEKVIDAVVTIQMYPNPSEKSVHIQGLPSESEVIEIRDLMGRSVRKIEVVGTSQHFDIQDLESGIYVIVVRTHAGLIFSERLIKK